MSKKIQKYAAQSELMNISIKFMENDKVHFYKFNLFEELKVSEEAINKELKTQSSSFAFIAMLHKILVRNLESLEAQKKRVYAKKYIEYKTGGPEASGRPPSDDLAKQRVEADVSYTSLIKKAIDIKYQAGVIEYALKSFEQRKDTLQSLSANLRNENKV